MWVAGDGAAGAGDAVGSEGEVAAEATAWDGAGWEAAAVRR